MSLFHYALIAVWVVSGIALLAVCWNVASKADQNEPNHSDVDELAAKRRHNEVERWRRELGR
jgi:hypothetical protein